MILLIHHQICKSRICVKLWFNDKNTKYFFKKANLSEKANLLYYVRLFPSSVLKKPKQAFCKFRSQRKKSRRVADKPQVGKFVLAPWNFIIIHWVLQHSSIVQCWGGEVKDYFNRILDFFSIYTHNLKFSIKKILDDLGNKSKDLIIFLIINSSNAFLWMSLNSNTP